ncbi:PIN domain-containing protein [Russula earlei]|uniref:PIN domain-containing protein n=1 Tax=Russula earlei TaxID=71964 RepID=A0ACC0UKF9_9AGAM|nr:PIN domain-containing protein [Russula earlei]
MDDLTDATLRRIDEAINQDVEMQASYLSQTQRRWCMNVDEIFSLVVDTNILLHQLDALQQFVVDIEHHLPFNLQIIIPGIVISELDRQKTRNDKVAWAARLASTWLLEKVKERRFVKGQTHEETCKGSGKWNVKDVGEPRARSELNDNLILDCCQYFSRRPHDGGVVRRVALCSGDKNLCVKAESVGIRTLSPTNGWTSRAIAMALFAGVPVVRLSDFDGLTSKAQRRILRTNLDSTSKPAANARVDAMEVDEEPIRPSHPLDVLHLEVVEHFSHLLLRVVDRVGGPEVPWNGPKRGAVSQHAPGWARIGFSEWTPRECVRYLGRREGLGASGAELDKLENFLMYPDKQGGRKGQDWTRSDWDGCVRTLEEIGRSCEDEGLRSSVSALERFARGTFLLRMRPTGM